MMGITTPENWDAVVAFAETSRDSYAAIRDSRPNQVQVRKAMLDFIENAKFENCVLQKDYIRSMKLNID